MIAVDSSVVVAAFASWHDAHRSAAAALARKPLVTAHVLIESFSVLTRLPPPHRVPAGLVVAFLTEHFARPPLVLPAAAHLRLIEQAAAGGIAGGSIYDALIAATVRQARARLLTRDRRAAATYEAVGAEYEVLG